MAAVASAFLCYQIFLIFSSFYCAAATAASAAATLDAQSVPVGEWGEAGPREDAPTEITH